jgi:hypothetical protein
VSAPQHTAGPWTLGTARMGFHNEAMMPVLAGSRYVAQVCPNARATRKARNNRTMHLKVFSPEDMANARLLIAAPDLLSALEGVRAVRPSNWEDDEDPEQVAAWQAVDAALRQAATLAAAVPSEVM